MHLHQDAGNQQRREDSMAPGEKEQEGPAKNAIRKIRTATLVINLARGWQQWANENNSKQAQEPTGWLPGSTQDVPQDPKPVTHPTPHQNTPSITSKSSSSPEGFGDGQSAKEATEISPIKRKEVTKTIVSKAYERGGDVGHLSHRYENNELGQPENDVDRLLQGRGSPIRRRKCANLVSGLTKGWRELEEDEPKWRSDSIDTEDSGYGGETEERAEQDVEQAAAARIKRPLPSQ